MNNTQLTEDYQASLQAVAQFLRQEDDFLVVSHLSPDGDAISSTSAMGFILKALGKKYSLLNEGHTPQKFKLLLDDEDIINYSSDPVQRTFDRVIFVDCADASRIGQAKQVVADNAVIINIDHHVTNNAYGQINVVRTSAAATVEIIYDLIKTLNISWTPKLASCIYAGLLTDTGGFRYSNTTPAVFAIAERMLREGVAGAMLAERLLETMSLGQVQLMKETLSTLSFSEDCRIAWVKITTEMMNRSGALDEDTEGLINISRNVQGVEVALLFKQKAEHEIKISFRSKGEVDVSRLAQIFGGGGHVRASGATIMGTMEEAVARIVEAVKEKI
jgi:phosphoesterase RecJ-like protein